MEAIHNAIENLPEECRRIFKVLYYEELQPAEVAELLQISVNTVYVQKSRAVSTGLLLRFIIVFVRLYSLFHFACPYAGYLFLDLLYYLFAGSF